MPVLKLVRQSNTDGDKIHTDITSHGLYAFLDDTPSKTSIHVQRTSISIKIKKYIRAREIKDVNRKNLEFDAVLPMGIKSMKALVR
jgi:hypothetical protein